MQPFTKRVIEIIQTIPSGKVMTYGQIAEAAGSKRAARQVVRILHAMSQKYALPWHRVVNAKGDIAIKDDEARFTQIALLEEEGVFVDGQGRVDLETYRYETGLLQAFRDEIISKGILDESYDKLIPLQGGTHSKVGLLSSEHSEEQYVIKANEVRFIKAEVKFLQLYRSISLLPKLLYVDPEYRYFVYEYIQGEVSYSRQTKRELMLDLVRRMIKYYVRPDIIAEYVWVGDPTVVANDLRYTHSTIGSHLSEEDHKLVKDIHKRKVERLSINQVNGVYDLEALDDVYVIHGDLGVHNFLFQHGQLTGIIDPIPSVGRRLYDLLYAFCSSPDDLTLATLQEAVKELGEGEGEGSMPTHELVEDMIMALYSRIGTCLVHHPDDLEHYLSAWHEWKARILGLLGTEQG